MDSNMYFDFQDYSDKVNSPSFVDDSSSSSHSSSSTSGSRTMFGTKRRSRSTRNLPPWVARVVKSKPAATRTHLATKDHNSSATPKPTSPPTTSSTSPPPTKSLPRPSLAPSEPAGIFPPLPAPHTVRKPLAPVPTKKEPDFSRGPRQPLLSPDAPAWQNSRPSGSKPVRKCPQVAGPAPTFKQFLARRKRAQGRGWDNLNRSGPAITETIGQAKGGHRGTMVAFVKRL